MRTMHFLAGAAFAALIACAPVMAQDTPSPPPGAGAPGMGGPGWGHRGMHRPGMGHRPPITRAAVEKMVADRFAMLDTNHDGVVTRAELDAARDKRRTEMQARMEARIKEHQTKMFDRLDANHDGTISREEFAAAMSPHRGPRGDGPPPPGGAPATPGAMAAAGGPGSMGPGPMGHGFHHRDGERFAMRGRMGGPERMLGGRWFDLVVDDHGGKVTLAEVKKGALTLFDRLDTNHDGTISPDERRTAFRGMRWRGGFGQDRGGQAQPPAKG